jgi:predicted Zn-dependent peptidase
LRETRGFTYGAFSGFGLRRSAGPFIASAEVVTAKTDSALTEFLKELRAIRDTVPSDELAKTKNYLALGFPGAFETIEDLAARIEELSIYGLPEQFYADYTSKIGAVTAAAAQRAAAANIEPDALAVVVVGDRARIEPGIRALNLGPVRIVGVEDVVP